MCMSDKMTFEIVAFNIDFARLCKDLDVYFPDSDDPPEFKGVPRSHFRSIEPSVLVAIVTASATALAAFITGVLAIAKQHNAKKIVIRSNSKEIQVPYDISQRDLKTVLDVLNEMERPKIVISADS